MSTTRRNPGRSGLPAGTAMLSGLDVPACLADAADAALPVWWFNDAFRELAADALGRPLAQVLGGPVAEAAKRGVPARVEAIVREAGHVEVSLAPVDARDSAGRWVVALVLDVDARSVEVREAQASGRRWRQLVETLPAASYRTDWSEEAAFRYLSPQIEDILGYPAQHFVSNRLAWATSLHPDDRDRYIAAEAASHRHEAPFDTEFRMIAADGSVKVIWEREAIVRDEHGRPRFSHGLLIDVTDRRR